MTLQPPSPERRPTTPARHQHHVGDPSLRETVESYLSGCNCHACEKAYERALHWSDMRTNGAMTPADIAAIRDVPESLVRRETEQANGGSPPYPWSPSPRVCVTCEQPLTGEHHRRRYHHGSCERLGKALRYHVSETFRATKRATNAEIAARRGEMDAERARAVIADPATQFRQRTIHEGSHAWVAAVEAYTEGLPIFGRLPPTVKRRVRSFVRQLPERP